MLASAFLDGLMKTTLPPVGCCAVIGVGYLVVKYWKNKDFRSKELALEFIAFLFFFCSVFSAIKIPFNTKEYATLGDA